MSILKRVLFSMVWNIGCIAAEIATFMFLLSIIFWGLLQLQPMVRFIIDHRVLEDWYSYPWVDNVVNFIIGLMPVTFMIFILVLVTYLTLRFVSECRGIESYLWNRIPNKIKGNDIPDSPKFLIPIAVLFMLFQCAVVSWACYQGWGWQWYLGGLVYLIVISSAGIAVYFGLKSKRKRQLMGNTKERTI